MSRSKAAFNPTTFGTREGRQKFYDSDNWRRLRAYQLNKEPFCQCAGCSVCTPSEGRPCGKLGEIVDHILDVQVEPNRALDPTNIRTLCRSCHNSRSARNSGKVLSATTKREKERVDALKQGKATPPSEDGGPIVF